MAATKEHCVYCFDALTEKLLSNSVITAGPEFENGKYPLFVTWNVLRGGEERELRGCIGLYQYARIAAFKDTRFSPISREELVNLEVGVSLLTDFEQCRNWKDWIIGTHGIRINYAGRYSATYLPEVASEQGWDHEETLSSLLRKAGYNGTITEQIKQEIQVERYQSSKAYMSFAEYAALRGLAL